MKSMVTRAIAFLMASALLLSTPLAAHAIGWDGDDFLIGGGPSFTNKIGVFDHDLTFKGLLVNGFVGVGGLDFDSQGNLVAVSGILREVRVYDSSGAHVGGFTRTDTLLGTGSNLKVAPDGSYVVATQNFDGTEAEESPRLPLCPGIYSGSVVLACPAFPFLTWRPERKQQWYRYRGSMVRS